MAEPPPPEPQVGALCEVLNAFGVRYVVFGSVAGRLEPRHFRGDSLAVGLITEIGYLDVVLHPRGFEDGYRALAPRAITVDVDGVDVIICDLEDLIVSKELLGREKDRQHLPELRRVALQQPLRPTFDPVDKHDITTDEPEPPSLEL